MGSLYLARHATTAASASGRNLGQRDDPPLIDAGAALARQLGEVIRLELVEHPAVELRFVSSPALRCRQTIESVAAALDEQAVEVEIEPGIIEIDYGAWDGLTAAECAARDPALRAAWEVDPAATRCPDGESGADVAARAKPVFDALGDWLGGADERAAIVVAHNHVNRVQLCRLLGWPLRDYRRRLEQSPGAYNVIGYAAEGTSIVRINAPARLTDKPLPIRRDRDL